MYRKWAPCRTRYIPHLSSRESGVQLGQLAGRTGPVRPLSSSYNRRAAAACTDQMRRDRHVSVSEPNVLEQLSDHFPGLSIDGFSELSTGGKLVITSNLSIQQEILLDVKMTGANVRTGQGPAVQDCCKMS